MVARTAVWLVPDLIVGSGGHRTILQHADEMQRAGWRVVLYLEALTESRRESPAQLVERLFGYRFAEVLVGWDSLPEADAYFATIWYSAQVVRDVQGGGRKFYFVQDHEACFHPLGDAYLRAENSYRYGLHAITIGNWLTHKLNTEFAPGAQHFEFCADLNIYRPLDDVRREPLICFVHQPEKPRRCTEIGLEALSIVKYHRPEVGIALFGSTAHFGDHFDHENLGLLDLAGCNRLYNRSALGLCISASNPSRVPFEMMAAGLPVVEVWRENTRYDLPEEATLLCEPSAEALAAGLMLLLDQPERRAAMSAAGRAFMADRDLGRGLAEFMAAVERVMRGEAPAPEVCQPRYTRPPVVNRERAIAVPPEIVVLNWKGRLVHRLPPFARRTLRGLVRQLRRVTAA